MDPASTIAAIASAPGPSSTAIVRLAGPQVLQILSRVLRATPDEPGPHRAVFLLPRDQTRSSPKPQPSESPGPLPLPIRLLLYRAPRSYTAEDAAELLIPGNPHLAGRVLDALLAAGAARAGPGEFTARAFLAGRLTMEQAEAINQLIAAERDDELDAARDLLAGTTGDTYRTWADEIATLLALVEAGIDFTDQEDVVPIAPSDLASRLESLAATLRRHIHAPAEPPSADPTVVLVGPPNAGKSTLFNALLGRPRAVVADAPGTTRDVLAEPLDPSRDLPGAAPVILTDLAGLADTAVSHLDAEAQRLAREHVETADVLVHCDPSGRFDLELPSKPTICVRTKADLVSLHHDADIGALSICALDGWNIPPLRRAIADLTLASRVGVGLAVLPRHRRAIEEAAAHLAAAHASIDPAARSLATPELTAGDLRAALDQLGSLTGQISPDDVIGRVFATFCVGK